MRNVVLFSVFRTVLCFVFVFSGIPLFAQAQTTVPKSKSDFWQKVQIGGGIGLSIGSGYTDIALAPSAIYNFNRYVALGLGLQYAYAEQKNYYASHLYGGSIIGLINPIEEIQLSVELEQLRANLDLEGTNGYSRNFWNTGLFLGGGYRNGNVTLGVRYNVLYKKSDNVYGQAFIPFIRVYF